MKGSLYIGKVSGIKIFIHWTFTLLIFWIVFSGLARGRNVQEILLSLGFILSIFACVVLHELGHALTAKRFNFKTKDIILLPIGGLARMEGLPDKPLQELLVAIMGPVVNIIISLLLFIVLKLNGNFPSLITDVDITKNNFLFQLYSINIFLALFNLIPAFPMDGGRILRALLAMKLPRVKATQIAAYIGQFIAALFVFTGFFFNPFLVFIGLFVFIGAWSEANLEKTRVQLNNIKVGDVLMHNFSILSRQDPLSKAVSIMLDTQEHSFIVKSDGEVEGTLSKKEILEGLAKYGNEVPIEQVMKREVTFLKENDKISEVMQKFPDDTRALIPVIEEEKVVGVINMENVLEYVQIRAALKEPKNLN
jgi:Zn-dependent protease/predicted transcriptional regulator